MKFFTRAKIRGKYITWALYPERRLFWIRICRVFLIQYIPKSNAV